MSGPIEILRKACYCRKRVQQLEETIRLQERPALLFLYAVDKSRTLRYTGNYC